jgi:hypothetical protein
MTPIEHASAAGDFNAIADAIGIPGTDTEWLSPDDEQKTLARIDAIREEQERSGFTSIEDTAWLTLTARKLLDARIATRAAVIANAQRVRDLEQGQQLLPLAQNAAWKSCNDEMPDDGMTVMVHHPEENEPVGMGYLSGTTWRCVDGLRVEVTHWMDVPEPPTSPTAP